MAAHHNWMYFLVVVVVTVQLAYCQNYDEWIRTIPDIGGSMTLNCSEWCVDPVENGCHPREQPPNDMEIVSWMGPAPNLYVWNVLLPEIPWNECPNCSIGNNGWTFTIQEFDPTVHIGIYHCMYLNRTRNQYWMVKWGINMRGPYFEDLLEKYEQNIIIGISAFGGFLAIAITALLTYKFRWRPDESGNTNIVKPQYNYGSNYKTDYGVETGKYSNIDGGKINLGYDAEKENAYQNMGSPPQYNGTKADVQVHQQDEPQPGTSGSSSSSEAGSVRRREVESTEFPTFRNTTPHPAEGIVADEQDTRF